MNTLETIQSALPNLTIEELEAVQTTVTALLKQKQEEHLQQLRQELEKMAKNLGVPYETLVAKLTSNSGKSRQTDAPKRKIPYLYRHPTQPDQGWTGRGLPPKWLKEWEAQGRSRDELRIR